MNPVTTTNMSIPHQIHGPSSEVTSSTQHNEVADLPNHNPPNNTTDEFMEVHPGNTADLPPLTHSPISSTRDYSDPPIVGSPPSHPIYIHTSRSLFLFAL